MCCPHRNPGWSNPIGVFGKFDVPICPQFEIPIGAATQSICSFSTDWKPKKIADGDPAPWAIQDSLLATVLSFINCEKYPPSFLYLSTTLGPALMLVAALERVRGPAADWIATFGRVPFFYYVVHIFLLHALAIVFAWATIGDIGWLFGPMAGRKPAAYGLPLAGIYAVWLAVVVALYPLCRWFAGIKRRRTEWWWSYL